MAAAEAPAPHSVSDQIDVRRAKQLVERAQSLAERGDIPAAILACRQSIALASGIVDGHVLLASLLHRSGDSAGAAAEYEKVLQIAPDSVLEQEALKTARQESPVTRGNVFHFDDGELFDESAPASAAPNMGTPVAMNVAGSPAEPRSTAPAVAPSVPPAEATPGFKLAGAGLAAEQSAAARAIPRNRPATAPRVAASPAAPMAPKAPAPRPAAPATPLAPAPVAASAPAPAAADLTAAPAPAATSHRRADDQEGEDRRASDRRNMKVPVAVERRRRSERREDEPVAAAGPAPIDFNALPLPVPPPVNAASYAALRASASTGASAANRSRMRDEEDLPLLQRLASNSLLLRVGAPLGVLVIVGLGVMAWSLNRPVSMNALPDVAPPPQQVSPSSASNTPLTGSPAVPPPPVAAPALISNAPAVAAAPGASATHTTAHKTGHAATGKGLQFPNGGTAPAAIPGAGLMAPATSLAPAPPASNGGIGSLPSPQISASVPAPVVVQALPPDAGSSGGDQSSSGGIPLNPAGSPNAGYIIPITQSHIPAVAAPARPSNQARNTERDAAAAARAGNNGQAINGITNALNSDTSDQGYRYQTRANLFLQRGDYRRAIDDFQNAISAYNNQIGRGEDITTAQAGLRASQSGLNVAYAGLRSGQ